MCSQGYSRNLVWGDVLVASKCFADQPPEVNWCHIKMFAACKKKLGAGTDPERVASCSLSCERSNPVHLRSTWVNGPRLRLAGNCP